MTGPLRQATPDEPREDRFGPDNLTPGTSLSRLAHFIRNTPAPGSGDSSPDATFQSSPAELVGQSRPNGVPNPYGVGLEAYEPNTVLFDDYATAYTKVQESKAEEQAQQQLLTLDFTQGAAPGGGSGPVTGVPFADLFTRAGTAHGVPPALLAAVARAESNFRTDARSPAGAQGLMQFMPGTASGLGVNPFDPASSIDGAARYLKSNFDKFGSWDLALAAYNAGPGAVSRYGGVPPYTETQNYVRRVNAYFQEYGGGGHLQAVAGGGGANFATGGLTDAGGKTRGMVSAAMQLAARRVPYVWGGTSANGVDCSGLIYYAARAAGIDWKRYRAVDYGRMGTAVSLSQARAGDIVYYDNPGDVDHVGIYIGNGQMVQAPFSGQVVKVTGVGNFTSIRRVFDDGAFSNSPDPWGQPTALYNGMTYNPWSQGIYQQALVQTPAFGGIIGRAIAPNPPVIERTQRSSRVRMI